MNVDANKVVNRIAEQLKQLIVENAVMKEQIDLLQEENEKLKKKEGE